MGTNQDKNRVDTETAEGTEGNGFLLYLRITCVKKSGAEKYAEF
jgi:hypothetical protein